MTAPVDVLAVRDPHDERRIIFANRNLAAAAACYAITFVALPALPFLAAFVRGWMP